MRDDYDGIIVKTINYGENDKIVHIMTRELGKISAIAKGVRKIKRNNKVNIELFNYGTFSLFKGKGLYSINGIDIHNSFFHFREDMEKLTIGSFILEILNIGTLEEEENEQVYLLLLKTLNYLESFSSFVDYRKLLYSFQIKFISLVGFKPQIRKCVNCSDRNMESGCFFSIEQGGFLCKNCKDMDKSSIYLSKEVSQTLDNLLYLKIEYIKDIMWNENIESKVKDILSRYLLNQLERKYFKSQNMLDILC